MMELYLKSDKAAQDIQPTMWLSIIDITTKLERQDLTEFGRARFYETFEWDSLLTTSIETRKEQDETGKGRNVRR